MKMRKSFLVLSIFFFFAFLLYPIIVFAVTNYYVSAVTMSPNYPLPNPVIKGQNITMLCNATVSSTGSGGKTANNFLYWYQYNTTPTGGWVNFTNTGDINFILNQTTALNWSTGTTTGNKNITPGADAKTNATGPWMIRCQGWDWYNGALRTGNIVNITVNEKGNLTINLTTPIEGQTTNVNQNTTFNVNTIIQCVGGNCGNVNVTIRYNNSGTTPDTLISTTTGDTPFYISDYALGFAGITQSAVNVSNGATPNDFDIVGAFNLTLWIKPNGTASCGGSAPYYLARTPTSNGNPYYQFGLNGTCFPTFTIGTRGVAADTFTAGQAIPANGWTKLTIMRNNSWKVYFFYNDQFISSFTDTNKRNSSSTTQTVGIGADKDFALTYWNGTLNNIYFTNNTATTGIWLADEGSGTTVADSSGKGHNGTIWGSVSWIKFGQPQSCGTMNQNSVCKLDWTVNATGSGNTIWAIDANLSSDVSDANNSADAYIKIIGAAAGVTYYQNLTDSILYNEAQTKQGNFTRSLSDSTTYNELLRKYSLYNRSLSDSFTYNELLIKSQVFIRSLSDSITYNELINILKIYNRNPADTITYSELLTKLGLFNRSSADSLAYAELLYKAGFFKKSLSDSLTYAELRQLLLGKIVSLSDTITYNEILTKLGLFSRNPTDSLAINELLNKIGYFNRSVSDMITYNEIQTKFALFQRKGTDTLTYNELLVKLVLFKRGVTDSIIINELLRKLGIYTRSQSDTLTYNELINAFKVGGAQIYYETLTDSLTVSEFLTKVGYFYRNPFDTLIYTEAINVPQALIITTTGLLVHAFGVDGVIYITAAFLIFIITLTIYTRYKKLKEFQGGEKNIIR